MKPIIRMNAIRTKIIVVLMIFIIPLITLLIVYNFYSLAILRQQTAQTNKSVLSLYTETLDVKLNNVTNHLVDIVATNANFNLIRTSKDDLKIYFATYDILASLQQGLNTNKEVSLFFVYGTENQVYREVYGASTGHTFLEREKIREALKELTNTGESYIRRRWFPYEIDGDYYLLRIFGRGGTYVGAAIDISKLEFPLSKMAVDENYVLLYNTTEGMPLIHQAFIEENNIQLRPNNETFYISGDKGRFMVLSEQLSVSDMYMTAIIPETSIIQGLDVVQGILLVVSLLTILLIPLSIFLLRKSVVKPLDKLVDAINEIKKGNWDTRMEVEFISEEFKLVNDTFNTMIDEIKTLKIVAYEEKFEKQKAKLDHLLAQIKPHFFLNALKNLYGMAQREHYEAIQTMILGLSNHFRYMFKDNFALVKLKDEINYVKNYLDMQYLSMPVPPECRIDMDERLQNVYIPPITIQTFVENALKYALAPDRNLKITIKVIWLKTEEGNFADITVTDNGNGFSSTLLEKLNLRQGEIIESDEHHIGIENVKQRLRLIFGDKAILVFSSSPAGGGISEMIIPIQDQLEAEVIT